MIKGIVADKETKKPLPYANIAVLDKDKKPTVKGTSTNKKGEFILDYDIPYGMAISYVGYETLYADKKANTNVYYLKPEYSILEGAVVTGKRIYKHNKWIAPVVISGLLVSAYIYFKPNKSA